MLNLERVNMRQSVNHMNAISLSRSKGQMALNVFDAVAFSVEEAEKLQFEENVRRVVAEARRR